jgi:hypothetical protein
MYESEDPRVNEVIHEFAPHQRIHIHEFCTAVDRAWTTTELPSAEEAKLDEGGGGHRSDRTRTCV